jgi:CubicO group peptidase (beta-lactamase class C family)
MRARLVLIATDESLKNTFAKASLGALIVATMSIHTAQAQSTSDDAQRIARIESSLTTPVVIKGQPVQRMTLQSRMRYYHIPAVSIAFFDASGIRWTRAYGATPETLFQAGSISKPVSAVGTMRAVQDGLLKLDQNVNDVLPGWKVPENALTAKQPVTLRELLSMTAGTTVPGFEGYERGKPLPTLQQVLDGVPPANSAPVRVDLQPGTQYRYSGGGSTIAQLLLLSMVHESFANYMHDKVLAPMGMTDSTFEQPLPQPLWARAATATDPAGKTYPGDWHVYPTQFAAGLWTTPTDLAKFAIGVQRSLDGAPDAVLSQQNAELMLTAVKDHYGLGFESHGDGKSARFGHNGANAGFQADLIMYRGGEGVAIMTNSDNGIDLIVEVLSSIGFVYDWKDYQAKERSVFPMAPSAGARYVGRYDMSGTPLTIEQRDGALYIDGLLGSPTQIYPESPSAFFILKRDLELTFDSDSSGNVNGLSVRQDEATATAQRVKP